MSSKVIIVTGASKGIGAAVTQTLLKANHKVVLVARSKEPLESTKQSHPGQVEYIAGDVTDSQIPSQLVDLAIKSFGKLDGLVINHGILEPKSVADHTIDDFKRIYDIGFFSCVAVALAGLAELRKTKGCIVWVSSGAAVKAYKGWGSYGTVKAAMNSLSSHIAIEEPEITSLAVAPGRVNTDMQAVLRADGQNSMDKTQYATFVDQFNKGELLKPEQPGGVIARFVVDPTKELSGQYYTWNAPEMAKYQA